MVDSYGVSVIRRENRLCMTLTNILKGLLPCTAKSPLF